ncbi:MAG: Hsp20/alpha crystallin family protein [Carnobacterium sp.]|nr:Hsp20/alpha crystallin family protein [Carnobacterium sp.]
MINKLHKKDDFPVLTDFFSALLDEECSLLDKFSSSFTKNSFKTDIHETDQEYELNIDLPGFDKGNISLNFNDNGLTVQAKRQEEKSEKENKGTFIKQECSYRSMTRQFYLENIDEEKAKAKYKDGVLRLTIPKLSSKEATKNN